MKQKARMRRAEIARAAAAAPCAPGRAAEFGRRLQAVLGRTRAGRLVIAVVMRLSRTRIPAGAGVAAAAVLILSAGLYGAVQGGHGPATVAILKDLRDGAANAVGFRIEAVALSGQRQITREEILATAGVTGRTSLLFLDALEAREKLKSNPWIADATVLKLYPGRLQIQITERHPYALWQKDGRVSVIAEDGTVLEPYVARRFVRLPLVVGTGAGKKAKEFLALLERHPEIMSQVRASILVADRRWNLKLKNGLDVRLPEHDAGEALQRLAKLDRDSKLLARDITAIDLRLADRVTLRLSDAAAQARDAIFVKDKKPKKKGSDA
jgi:cell division protein FtsQ